MKMKPICERAGSSTALSAVTALAATMLVAHPAGALAVDDSQATPILVAQSLASVERFNDLLLVEPTEPAKAPVGEIELSAGSVEVPTVLEEGVTLTDEAGESIGIGLPNAAEAGMATALGDGVVTFPGEESANSIIVGDVGVQMLTTIAGADAPTRYSYEVSFKPGQHLELTDSGAAVVNGDGTVALAVASAWAKDANGKNIRTNYEINGSTLTQVVVHTAHEGIAYPVVADPIWIAPWVYRCLIGIGLNGPQIARIAQTGTPSAILAAFGYGAFRCIIGR
ncbi:hypothetical protein [Pseudarthrobacter sp. CCNWLW207]|uniref:hypothetical protein n=1 Tax=Pseudarthrobacter sp. CCNWLW207 TaxID=3127468 RepID=UPI0030780819